MAKLFLALLLVCATATGAAGQCCGDCAGDGTVTIDDLIRAVNNALNGCATATPTGPPATATRVPTATPTPAPRCASSFTTSGSNLCAFRGTYNRGCGEALASTFSSNGSVVVVTLATNLIDPPTVSFSATVTSATRATLTAWSSDDFQTIRVTAGTLQLNNDGRELVVFPNDSPFQIMGCAFVQYIGAYVPPRRSADAAAGADSAAALAHLGERPAPEIPELARPSSP